MKARLTMFLTIAGLTAGFPALAQDPDGGPGVRAEVLRQMIEERFAERLQVELGLDDETAARVKEVLETWSGKRRSIEQDDRKLRQKLRAEMRPGVPADQKAVGKLVGRLLDNRLAYVQTFKDELADLSDILTPVQQAQYLLLRDRLAQRVEEIKLQRQINNKRRQR